MSKTLKDIKNEKYTGEYIWYYKNGNMKRKYNFKDGKKHGECIDYFLNKNIRYNEYKNGKLDGINQFYCDHIKGISEATEYTNGKMNGMHKEWGAYGRLIYECKYVDGYMINNY
jgi:hypothetical protein